MINKKIIEHILDKYSDLIDNYDFADLYKKLIEDKELIEESRKSGYAFSFIGEFSEFLLNNNINPLEYMNEVPRFFLLDRDLIKSINIPNSVTSIGDSAFDYCRSLTSINIPNSVKLIGEFAFEGCLSLTSINIPNSVTSIGNFAFSGCTSLTIYAEAPSKSRR